MATTQSPRTHEFSRVFKISDLTGDAVRQRFSATASECAAVADRLGVQELTSLEGDLELRRGPIAGTYVVAGQATAVVVQACVVTLARLESRIEADFETVYADDPSVAAKVAETEDDGGLAETPESVFNGGIDLGEEVVQQVACAIDPYPRSPGAEIDRRWTANGDETPDSGPFATLAKVRPES
jgi:hypothetical protein